MVTSTKHSLSSRLTAWSVHVYTGLGLPLMYLATQELLINSTADHKDPRMFFLWLWLSIIVDSTDGALAKRVGVEHILPEFSGRRLDDIVDFLSFVFLPCVAFGIYELFPTNWQWFAIVTIMASGYGFCQTKAKTENAFVGFPSYWNIVLIYLYLLGLNPWINLAIVGFLTFMVFVPIHYVYPTRTTLLRPLTLIFATLWAISLMACSVFPQEPWTTPVTRISLSFPIYYLLLSITHHRRLYSNAEAIPPCNRAADHQRPMTNKQ